MQTLSADRRVTQMPLFRAPAPSPRDVDVHAISRPARAYTGDFYFTHRDGERLWIAIGDVAGKGVHAAVIMGMIQEELEHRITSCARTGCDPAITITWLDLFLRNVLPNNRFASVAIAQIRDSGSVAIVNGGHCPLVIARRDGSIETIGSTGPVLGILPDAKWRSIEMPFHRGDALLAYTDGVTEARSNAGEELGLGALRAAFSNAAAKRATAREIGDDIAATVERHSGARRDDDVTIIIARR
ncbi:MAG TPA: PP2C family protein-serine/threonine phosphatase [Thermoanaerobaculia bacterium]